MAASLVGRRQRRTSQPLQSAVIDRSNPLTQGLSLLVNLGGGQHLFDAVTGAKNTVTGTKGAVGLQAGQGFGTTVGVGTTDVVTTPLVSDSVARSFLVFGKIRALGGGNLGRMLANNQVSIYYDNSFGSVVFQQNFTTGSTTVAAFPYTLGGVFCLAVAFDSSVGTNPATLAVNGLAKTPVIKATGSGARLTTSAPITLGNVAAGIRNLDGDLYIGAAWDRLLSQDELNEVTRNPWQLFSLPAPRPVVRAATGRQATIAFTPNPFVVAISATDPDTGGAGITLGAYGLASTATVRSAAVVALAPGRYTVAVTATDPDTGGVSLTPGAFTMSATASTGSTPGSIAVVLGSYTLAATASDPDASAISLALGTFAVSSTGTVSGGGSAALVMDSYLVSIVAADPETGGVGITLSPYTVVAFGDASADGSVSLFLSAYTVDAEGAQTNDGSIVIALGVYDVDTEAETFPVDPVDAVAVGAIQVGPYTVTVTADTQWLDAVADIELALLPYTVTAVADTEPGDVQGVIDITLGGYTVSATANVIRLMGPTLSEIIPTLLNGLVDKRVWQLATPDNLSRDSNGHILPFILWHRVGGRDEEFIDQTMPTHRHARIQVQSCARGGIAADTLHEAVCQALLGSAYTVGVLGSPVGTYDADRKLHAPWQQFSIWFQP